jgi:dTDP-L-rhamnose 4-epimerase
VFEDGHQRRDFENVRDVARAGRLALESPHAGGQTFNVGSGQSNSVLEIAGQLAQLLDCPHLEPEIVARYRVGDIRHCYADISKARKVLGYEPQVTLTEGLRELAAWLVEQEQVSGDGSSKAKEELLTRGLVV